MSNTRKTRTMYLPGYPCVPATGSVRPTQGRTLAIAQVNDGSQSFNTVNTLRLLGRWMRMLVFQISLACLPLGRHSQALLTPKRLKSE
jgi:NAD(P)H-dependent FMN reductase